MLYGNTNFFKVKITAFYMSDRYDLRNGSEKLDVREYFPSASGAIVGERFAHFNGGARWMSGQSYDSLRKGGGRGVPYEISRSGGGSYGKSGGSKSPAGEGRVVRV